MDAKNSSSRNEWRGQKGGGSNYDCDMVITATIIMLQRGPQNIQREKL